MFILSLLLFGVITFNPQLAGNWLWPLLGACFSLSNVGYSLVAQAFPAHLAGRANTALNVLVFAGAFGLQWGIGILVDALRAHDWAVGDAYRLAFILVLAGQAAAIAWLGHARLQGKVAH